MTAAVDTLPSMPDESEVFETPDPFPSEREARHSSEHFRAWTIGNVKGMRSDVREIKDVVIGDPKIGNGIAFQTHDHARRIAELEKHHTRKRLGIIGAFTLVGAFAAGIAKAVIAFGRAK